MDDRKITHQDTNNLLIVGSGVVGFILFVIAVVWLRSYFFVVRNDVVEEQVLTVSNPKLEDLRAREHEELTTYGWVNREAGTIRIPIERAMELVAREAQHPGKQGE